MDISSARLTALLRQAMAPQAVPSAKVDAARAALVKAPVQPPLPSLRPQQAAPALAALPALADKPQQQATAQVITAYLALTEQRVDTAADAVASSAAARKPVSQGDEVQRGLSLPAVKAEDAGAIKPTMPSWFSLVVPQVSTPRRASGAKVTKGQGLAANPLAGKAQPSPQHWPATLGLASIAVGLIAFGITAFAWLVLR